MTSPITWIVVAAILLIPPAAAVAVWLGVRRLARTTSAPKWAVWTGYLLATLAAFFVAGEVFGGLIVALGHRSGETVEPSQKARALAEAISEGMNCGALHALGEDAPRLHELDPPRSRTA
jgi:galactitol-specific phosphotransferase system IIC component